MTLEPILPALPILHSRQEAVDFVHAACSLFMWSLLSSSSLCSPSPLPTRSAHRPLYEAFTYPHKAHRSIFWTSLWFCSMDGWTNGKNNITFWPLSLARYETLGMCAHTGRPWPHKVLYAIIEGQDARGAERRALLTAVCRYGWKTCPSLISPHTWGNFMFQGPVFNASMYSTSIRHHLQPEQMYDKRWRVVVEVMGSLSLWKGHSLPTFVHKREAGLCGCPQCLPNGVGPEGGGEGQWAVSAQTLVLLSKGSRDV